MANNNNNTQSPKPVKSGGWLPNLISFVAVICVGISLLLSKVGLSGEISRAFSTIANVISYLILIALSLFYVAKRKKLWIWIVWAVAVVLIVVGFFLQVF